MYKRAEKESPRWVHRSRCQKKKHEKRERESKLMAKWKRQRRQPANTIWRNYIKPQGKCWVGLRWPISTEISYMCLNGCLLTTTEDESNRWIEHFQQLTNRPPNIGLQQGAVINTLNANNIYIQSRGLVVGNWTCYSEVLGSNPPPCH